jgi:hypothetical protein
MEPLVLIYGRRFVWYANMFRWFCINHNCGQDEWTSKNPWKINMREKVQRNYHPGTLFHINILRVVSFHLIDGSVNAHDHLTDVGGDIIIDIADISRKVNIIAPSTPNVPRSLLTRAWESNTPPSLETILEYLNRNFLCNSIWVNVCFRLGSESSLSSFTWSKIRRRFTTSRIQTIVQR